MTYSLAELVPTSDHENIGLMLDGQGNDDYYDLWFGEQREAAKEQIARFNQLWVPLKESLQDPFIDTGSEVHGFTGHRHVVFETAIGKCALGFQLAENHSTDLRTIIAYRRKIYTQKRRRVNYTSDEFSLSLMRLIENHESTRFQYQLGVMAVWVDKFLAAKPYSE